MLFKIKINRIIHKKIHYQYKIKQKIVILKNSKIIIINKNITEIIFKKNQYKTIKSYQAVGQKIKCSILVHCRPVVQNVAYATCAVQKSNIVLIILICGREAIIVKQMMIKQLMIKYCIW